MLSRWFRSSLSSRALTPTSRYTQLRACYRYRMFSSESAKMQEPILLKGGTLLIHDEKDRVKPTIADLLVEDGRIAKIGDGLSAGKARVVDCRDKLISPGFIDTHRHMWQTLIKGCHADQTLIEYFPCGNMTAALHTPEELFWAQLSSCLEALDAGTTTVVDHAHCLYSTDSALSTIQATVESGLRSVYCYSITPRVTSWDPFEMAPEPIPDWAMKTFHNLASQAPFGDGRVTLGFAIDAVAMLSPEDAQSLFKEVRDSGSQLITAHAAGGGPRTAFGPGMITTMDKKGVLGPDILVSHSNFITKSELELLEKYDAHVSSTPASELSMGLGELVSVSSPEGMKHGSLGVDSHCFSCASMPLQMNLALQSARSSRAASLAAEGKWSRKVGVSVEEIFNLGTVNGARACGQDGEIGRIKEGARADLVIFDGTTPSMLASAASDPVAAIVFHSSIRDIDYVIVDGIIRKEQGKLKEVNIQEPRLWGNVTGELSWEKISDHVMSCREELLGKRREIDFYPIEDKLMSAFHWDKSRLLEEEGKQ